MGWYTGEQKEIVISWKEICRPTLRKVGYHSFVHLAKRHYSEIRQRIFLYRENFQQTGPDSKTYF